MCSANPIETSHHGGTAAPHPHAEAHDEGQDLRGRIEQADFPGQPGFLCTRLIDLRRFGWFGGFVGAYALGRCVRRRLSDCFERRELLLAWGLFFLVRDEHMMASLVTRSREHFPVAARLKSSQAAQRGVSSLALLTWKGSAPTIDFDSASSQGPPRRCLRPSHEVTNETHVMAVCLHPESSSFPSEGPTVEAQLHLSLRIRHLPRRSCSAGSRGVGRSRTRQTMSAATLRRPT